jgi:hypothetical protein
LKLSTGSPSLTFAKVTAIRADVADEREMVVTSRPAPDAPDRVEHLLSIDPPLNAQREVTLAIQRQSDGAIYRSREDQRYMGGAESLGTDFLSIKITWPTDQLVARLRFKTDPAAVPGGASWLPRGLALEVVAADGKPRQREAESPYVMLDYPTPSRIALVGGERSAEAVLTVYRPRLGHTYKLSWPLPEQDAMPCRLQVEQLREQLLSVPATPAGRRATDEFAIAALRLFNQIRGDIPDVKDWIGKAESYLHAFNPRRGMLVCVGTSGAKQDPMAGEFRYGMDVIGTAFRRRDVWAYSRAQSDRDAGFVRFESFPSDTVQFCLGCPLNWPNRSGWPVGVLTLASGEPLTTSDPARKPQWAVDVSAAITELWMKSISAVVPDAPALPRGDSRQINVDSAGSDEIID